MKVLVAESVATEGVDRLRERHAVDERIGCSRAELVALLPEYDALIVRSQVQVDAELIAAGTRLVVIGRAGVGVDNVDLDAASRRGIIVVNAPTSTDVRRSEPTKLRAASNASTPITRPISRAEPPQNAATSDGTVNAAAAIIQTAAR